MPTLANSQSFTIQQLQKSIIQRTNYIGYLYVQYSIVFRIQILTRYTFSSKTSIYNRKAAINSTFIYSLYREKVNIIYRMLHVVPLRYYRLLLALFPLNIYLSFDVYSRSPLILVAPYPLLLLLLQYSTSVALSVIVALIFPILFTTYRQRAF